MDGTTIPPAAQPGLRRPPNARARWSDGIGINGLLIMALAAVVYSVSNVAAYIATEPFSSWFPDFVNYLKRSSLIGVGILLAAVWVRRRFPARGFAQYAAAAGAIIVVTYAVLIWFSALRAWIDGEPFYFFDPSIPFTMQVSMLSMTVIRYTVVGFIITSAWLFLCAEAEHAAAAEQCAVDAERLDQQTAEARLQVLEAQIEPHFLFNTLAHVKRLYETDHAAGVRMLHDLADYLAGALPQMRAASTLGRELDHITAYLNIQQIRMGRRLAFAIDVPEALRSVELPPLMVLTLVENAIKHGLSPLPEGGRIDVRASVANGRLVIQVADTGQGFTKSGGAGTGLANTRARLASRYGPSASLSLALNTPSGVAATIELPFEAVAPGRAPP